MGPEGLEAALSSLQGCDDPNLLVGIETADDAGVYRIAPEMALVESTDIITPLVDDPFSFGRIAAANALSDIYAMGGRPVTVMNLAFFPACKLPPEVLRDILNGGLSAVKEAGACVVGGHTVEDDELKFGLAVTGIIHPEKIVRNSTPRPGDILFLTKPIGTGIISTAIKGEMAEEGTVREATRRMGELNASAAEVMKACAATACTDVTGFGLIGHATEMARGGGVTISLRLKEIPLLPQVEELVRDGMIPAGCYRNRDFYTRFTAAEGLSSEGLLPLFDPQTSGGLLVSIPPERVDDFRRLAGKGGVAAHEIGRVDSFSGCSVAIR